MCTRKGITKKTSLADYSNPRKGGIIGIRIIEGDNLMGVRLTSGDNDIVLVTRQGQSIRFHESDLRDQGRATQGVTGIRFKHEGDYVEAIEIVDQEATLLVANESGIGKRSRVSTITVARTGAAAVSRR
jgi:DNA gyrase subunit A